MSDQRDWDFSHCLCYLYIAFAIETDGELAEGEQHSIFQCVKEWLPETSDDELTEILNTAREWYVEDLLGNGDGTKTTNTMHGIAAISKDALEPRDRKHLLSDLVRISVADSNFDEKEKEWIRYLAEVMDVDFKI